MAARAEAACGTEEPPYLLDLKNPLPTPPVIVWRPFWLGTSLAFYRGQEGPSLENSEESLKRGSRGLSAPGPKKLEKESKMTIFQVFFGPLALSRQNLVI